jgi:hypothetical protein
VLSSSPKLEFAMVEPGVIEAAGSIWRGQRGTARMVHRDTTENQPVRMPRLTALLYAPASSEPAVPERPIHKRISPNGTGTVTIALARRSIGWPRPPANSMIPMRSLYVLAAHNAGRIDAARESAQTCGMAQPRQAAYSGIFNRARPFMLGTGRPDGDYDWQWRP